ncbi:nucleotide pyrophosphohydrolase [Halorubrum ezzemoulense]|uniref:nucleotide pyrophosphohydrolase n=1 Tax=Halorubrum ezzemoulense TaxID=337243 RepID=UPI00232B6FC6|nr:nucleotide pyrophosphohydrolase [Halorubrum ezzemoulense]MDB9249303.1 nucleotide pyrophosphohydrolase [Halorubrum ezzemoulense]MDB9259541.1 nucleotide pyrophosphohydrolase [Halorubrum ezzemoulense]MDB9263007.1 nucleotide pyrophosphohydrolase [Halorubrum ezzemoulense]MDB9266563.1 nucleotide pyrophosphohydrolase [Halorubrum ezzemoulense]MDB9269902.1 nucleotide pyrophosphohydrolase [Halorubrum ezzemoulense]
MTSLDDLQDRYREFVTERDWNQFHTPKNLAEAISIEASELLEVFLWHDNHDAEKVEKDPELKARVEEELADVVIYSIAIATQLDIDLVNAVESKMDDNETRFDEDTAAEMTKDLQRWQRD